MSKISDLVIFTKKNPEVTDKQADLGNFPNAKAQQIAANTGVVVRGSKRILTAYGIRHALKGHGCDLEEKKRAQIGVIDSDFDLIPKILNDPDEVIRGFDGNRGKKALKFRKVIGCEYWVVMSVFSQKGELILEFDTMYKKQ